MDTFLHFGGLLGYPILALVCYIAFAAGRMTQRVTGLERRVGRIEKRIGDLCVSGKEN